MMKNISRCPLLSMSLLALLISVWACQRQEKQENSTPEECSFKLTAPSFQGTPAPTWSNGDRIAVYFGNSAAKQDAVFENTAGSGSGALFEGKFQVKPGRGFLRAFSPADAVVRGYDDCSISVYLGNQNPTKGSFDPNSDFRFSKTCNFTKGTSRDISGTLEFRRVLSLLRLDFNGSAAVGERIGSFTLSSTEAMLSGDIQISLDSLKIRNLSSARLSLTVNIKGDDKPEIGSEGNNSVFILIPPQILSKGAKVTFTAETDSYSIEKTLTLSAPMTFLPGECQELEFNFENEDCIKTKQETEDPEDNAFTRLDTPGIYNISDIDRPVPVLTPGKYDQTILCTYDDRRSFNICSVTEGKGVLMNLDAADIQCGYSLPFSITSVRESRVPSVSFNAKVVKCAKKMLWLRQPDGPTGVIFQID